MGKKKSKGIILLMIWIFALKTKPKLKSKTRKKKSVYKTSIMLTSKFYYFLEMISLENKWINKIKKKMSSQKTLNGIFLFISLFIFYWNTMDFRSKKCIFFNSNTFHNLQRKRKKKKSKTEEKNWEIDGRISNFYFFWHRHNFSKIITKMFLIFSFGKSK